MGSQSVADQLGIGQRVGSNQPSQRIPEQPWVLAVVEPEREFVGVGLEMLGRKLVIGADDAPLEQGPRRLDTVGGHVSANPLLGPVIDALMPRVLIFDVQVRGVLVGVDRLGVGGDHFVHERANGFPRR